MAGVGVHAIYLSAIAFLLPLNSLRRRPYLLHRSCFFYSSNSQCIPPLPSKVLNIGEAGWDTHYCACCGRLDRFAVDACPYELRFGLYHFNAIRWINSFPIVPGLGNLHGRLAFNQSFFTYVAVLNFYPFFGHGPSVANSFLLLLTIATFLHLLGPFLKKPSLLIESHPFQYASILFAFPVLGYLALSSDGLASPSPDLASTLLQLTMFVMLAQGIGELVDGQREQNYRVIVLVVLAATAVTIKLSNLAFSAVIIGFALAYTWQTSRPRIKFAVRIFLPAIMFILIWGATRYCTVWSATLSVNDRVCACGVGCSKMENCR